MPHDTNHLGQPVGFMISDWERPHLPPRGPMEGRFCRLEPLDPDCHASGLYTANSLDVQGKIWTYLPYGPFETLESYRDWVEQYSRSSDPLFYAIVDTAKDNAVGVASYLTIVPDSGSIEVGHINYSPLLQRTSAATEAMYLMMKQAFDLGYRRYEWKCNALNATSRAAAQRLGLSFEGIFRQAKIVKGRNRDTARYAAIDTEWAALTEAFLRWLDPLNFDELGSQRKRLSVLTEPILKQRG